VLNLLTHDTGYSQESEGYRPFEVNIQQKGSKATVFSQARTKLGRISAR